MQYRNAFVFIIWFLIFCISLMVIPKCITFIEIDSKPSDSPPWYIILTDLKQSIAATIGFILSIMLVFTFLKKKDSNFYLLLYFSVIWYGYAIGNGISILSNTSNIFNSTTKSTTWSNFSEYLNSPWKSYLYYVLLFLCSIIYYFANRGLKKSNNTSINKGGSQLGFSTIMK